MMQASKTKKAFSLLEILIGMTIAFTGFVLGVFAVTRLQSSVELQNDYTNVVSFLQETKNKAKNGIVDPDILETADLSESLPDIYMVQFEGENIRNYLCFYTLSDQVVCDYLISESNLSNSTIEAGSECKVIGFERNTSNLIQMETLSAGQNLYLVEENSSLTCDVLVKHNQFGSELVNFNFATNVINIEE